MEIYNYTKTYRSNKTTDKDGNRKTNENHANKNNKPMD